ncbi:VirB4 family type IV secretion system protein [Saccharolobus islandicus]|uniref:VirB4 family type IV secretion system protein n=1 Tax=Saccharolobus islandicus TaxID=43080 RepID=UPI0004940D55|nr:ATP-binding protein [Sulfolobus islandicus]
MMSTKTVNKKGRKELSPHIWYEIYGTPFFLEEEKARDQLLTDFATELKSHPYTAILTVTRKTIIEIEEGYTRNSTESKFYLGFLNPDEKPILYKYINKYDKIPEPRRQIEYVTDSYIKFKDGTFGQVIWISGFEKLLLEGILSVIYPLEISPLQIETFLEIITDDGSGKFEQRFRSYLGSILSRSARYIAHTNISSGLLELKNNADDLQSQINSGKQPIALRGFVVIIDNNLNSLETATDKVIFQLNRFGVKTKLLKKIHFAFYLFKHDKYHAYWKYTTNNYAALLYPFGIFRIEEQDGIFLGYDRISGNPIFINPWLTGVWKTNPHGLIAGLSGSGKTTTAGILVYRAIKKYDPYVYVIDPMNNFSRFFNKFEIPAEIIILDKEKPMGLDPIKIAQNSKGALSVDDFVEILLNEYSIPNYGRGLVKNKMERADSIEEAVDKICNKDSDICRYVQDMITGYDRNIWAGKPIDLTSKRVVINLGEMKDKLRKIVMTMLTASIRTVLNRLDRSSYKLIMIDEAHRLFDEPSTAYFVNKLYREGRALHASTWTITQSISDYFKNNETMNILAQAETQILMRHDSSEREILGKAGLNDEEIEFLINDPGRGQGILKLGSIKTFINMTLTEKELEVLRTE